MDDLTIEIRTRMFGLLGLNGAGKSTEEVDGKKKEV